MKIVDIEVESKSFHLIKPYRIANKTIDTVKNCIVKLKLENGLIGIGAGAPIDFITGETLSSCLNALELSNLSWLLHQSIYNLPSHIKQIQKRLMRYPAAAAALDIALYDAYGKLCKQPVVNILGQVHQTLPTSITIGIKKVDDAVKEAQEYIARGFKILKIKLGETLENDLEVIHALRNHLPNIIKFRVDMNQGYTLSDLHYFIKKTSQLNIELIEQPFKKEDVQSLSQLEDIIKDKITLDESIVSVNDMFDLSCQKRLCGIVNIKLMKCGGISSALNMAKLAELANIDLMWGCMDESIISISAALHAAFASPKTKYLDLDGSFDLLDDLVTGGFILENGYLRVSERPGLGLQLV